MHMLTGRPALRIRERQGLARGYRPLTMLAAITVAVAAVACTGSGNATESDSVEIESEAQVAGSDGTSDGTTEEPNPFALAFGAALTDAISGTGSMQPVDATPSATASAGSSGATSPSSVAAPSESAAPQPSLSSVRPPLLVVTLRAGTDDAADLLVSSGQFLELGDVGMGVAEQRVLWLTNHGPAMLRLDGIRFASGSRSDGDFRVAGCVTRSTLADGERCALEISFEPRSEGLQAAELLITYNGGNDSPFVVRTIATGVVAPPPPPPALQLRITPSSVDFGDNKIGAAAVTSSQFIVGAGEIKREVTITNDGGSAVKLAKIVLDLGNGLLGYADVSLGVGAPGCEYALLAPGGSCTFTVAYHPLLVGTQTAVLLIFHDGEDPSPIRLDLSGTAHL